MTAHRIVVPAALAAAFFLLAGAPLADQVSAPGPKVSQEVRDRLASGEKIRVMVALEIPPTSPRNLEKLRAEVARAQEAVLQHLGGTGSSVKRRFGAVPAMALEITTRALDRLEKNPYVRRIDLDAGGTGSLNLAVPLTNSDAVQALGFRGSGIQVAILDSGLDTDHSDLFDDLIAEACFCSGSGGCCPGGLSTRFGPGAAEDDHGHGSNVTGIVTSSGTVSSVGVSPDAEIVAIKVLDSNNSFCCSSDVVAGLDWIITTRPDVDVVNMSLGTAAMFAGYCDNSASFTMAYASAINTLNANGVSVFVSTGNNGSGTHLQAPSCVGNAISVGAVYDSNVGPVSILGCTDTTTAADQVTCFTNSNLTTDIFAPGAPITSDWLSNGLSTFFGTSQASPHAAGCAANMLDENPILSPLTIKTKMQATGVSVTDATNGLAFPRIDCLAAQQFTIGSGHVPDGSATPGAPLDVTLDPNGRSVLSWSSSCVSTDQDYTVYAGDLGTYYSHAPVLCSTGGATTATVASGDDRYYIVAPINETEGSHGLTSGLAERPHPGVPTACAAQTIAACSPACAHDRCTQGAALSSVCDGCVATICSADPYCCAVSWDSTCVAEVLTICGAAGCVETSAYLGAVPNGNVVALEGSARSRFLSNVGFNSLTSIATSSGGRVIGARGFAGTGAIYEINPATGFTVVRANVPYDAVPALDFAPVSTPTPDFIYGIGRDFNAITGVTSDFLFVLDTSFALVSDQLIGFDVFIDGIVFDDTGALFGVTTSLSTLGSGALITINPATGAPTFVGLTGFTSLAGVETAGISLIGSLGGTDPLSGGLVRINKATGAAAFLGFTRFSPVSGLAER